jgi:hypothetical protein
MPDREHDRAMPALGERVGYADTLAVLGIEP